MKRTLKVISIVAIVLFAVLLLFSKFNFLTEYNLIDLRSILVVIYLIARLKYFQMEVKDKEVEIKALKSKLEKTEKSIAI